MTILELQKKLQEAYEKYGDIEVSIQNGDDGGDYYGQREIVYVEKEGEYPNEMVVKKIQYGKEKDLYTDTIGVLPKDT